ncbi:MAG: hypothetical protein IJF83_06105 [Methanobrevibacter sp.]|nr:hypothetical protein [Methanobrevibacter sp.]
MITASSDKYYSSNGDYSIKLSSEEQAWLRFPVNTSSKDMGKTVNLSADIYAPTHNISSHLLLYNNDNLLELVELSIHSNNHFVPINLSTIILENTNKVYFNISCAAYTDCFVDNINLNIQ